MTDVLITKRIPGASPGDVLPLDDRMRDHVTAGNAEILPNEHGAWSGDPVEPAVEAGVHELFGTGNLDDLTDEELEAATAPEEDSDADTDTEDED